MNDFVETHRARFSPVWMHQIAIVGLIAGGLFSTLPTSVRAGDDAGAAETGRVQWKVDASQATLPAAGGTFNLRVRFHAPESKQSGREPLSLALVFDRSASMNTDAKIGFVRKAGHLVADNLTPQDYVALVTYNHEVQTLVPMHPVVNREYLHHRIDELTAVGETNISGGLLEGCAQLQSRLNSPGQHHVILLTDGLANRGVTDPNALVALVQQCAQRGIGVTTIGVGTDFNEGLLTRMAQAGRGHSVYAANADQIPSAVQKELGALLAVSVQNVKLKMKLPAGIEVLQVFGREEAFQPGVLDEPLGDLTSGEERCLLIKFRVASGPAPAESPPLTLQVDLSYDNLAAATRSQEQQTVTLVREAAQSVGQAPSTPVMAYAQLVENVDKIALAVKSMDRNLASEVLRIHQQEFPRLRQVANDSGDQDFVNKAYMFNHYSRELAELIEQGALHDHSQERAVLQKDLHYRRFMLDHHQHTH